MSNIRKELVRLVEHIEEKHLLFFKEIDKVEFHNQSKVIDAFRKVGIGEHHFTGTTGYGYGDIGRDAIEEVYSIVFNCQTSLVRSQLVSGTHAIACSLYGNLMPGDTLLSVTGKPYDTLENVIGIKDHKGSLKDLKVNYHEVDIFADGKINMELISENLKIKPTVVFIQRSRGYNWRNPLSIDDISIICKNVRELSPHSIILVDNCYGEFVDILEPTDVGADLIVGSLIKNPGGGIAPTGGYIAGNEEYVKNASYRLTAPGIGGHCGSTPEGINYKILFGLYLAPHVVGQALKSSILISNIMESLGFKVSPSTNSPRGDIITAIEFKNPDLLISFCQGIHHYSPIGCNIKPEPWEMPGYQHKVIMAGGTFIQGSSIELSIDAPIKPPFIGYIQGGLSYSHTKYTILRTIQKLVDEKLLKIPVGL